MVNSNQYLNINIPLNRWTRYAKSITITTRMPPIMYIPIDNIGLLSDTSLEKKDKKKTIV